jgi:hypothetical protein
LCGPPARDAAPRADDPRVRLEAEAVGGELKLKANVVDERGRAESFRRLRVVVGGPDGMSHSLPLEAVGAGAYAATLPLSRPGAYMATAVDEVTGEAAGIAGAVLSPGEELKPTGTDRALLARIAELTGGKTRDTLAGIFLDRPPRRFAYTPLAPWLLIVAASALLFMVAARRLSPPEALTRLPSTLKRALSGHREARERPTRPSERKADFEALKRAKARSAPAPGHAPRPLAPAVAPPRPEVSAEQAEARAPVSRPPSEPRQRSAAEILLERRRGRRGA